MSPEQRYKLECMKDKTPGSNGFLMWPILFVALAYMCREPIQQVAEGEPVGHISTVSHYETDILTVAGWHLL